MKIFFNFKSFFLKNELWAFKKIIDEANVIYRFKDIRLRSKCFVLFMKLNRMKVIMGSISVETKLGCLEYRLLI